MYIRQPCNSVSLFLMSFDEISSPEYQQLTQRGGVGEKNNVSKRD